MHMWINDNNFKGKHKEIYILKLQTVTVPVFIFYLKIWRDKCSFRASELFF